MNKIPRKASTLLLHRENDNERQVLMMLKNDESAFVPGAYVFPGGALDPTDEDPYFESICPGVETFPELGENEKPLPYLIAAIRETFEEAGILLALKNNSYISIENTEDRKKFAKYRNLLLQEKLTFSSIFKNEDIVPAVEKILYHSRWITPSMFPIRYDTRFFSAPSPPEQTAEHDGSELVNQVWISPQKALEEHRKGNFPLVLPTSMTLQELL